MLTSTQTSVALRPVRPEDEAFLYEVYASTRADEMALVDWSEEQKDAFLRMQFNAQAHFYQENYPGAEFQVILWDDQPAGRLYIHRRPDEIRIMDIALLPEYRRHGIGSHLLNQILDEARANRLPVTIHVERMSPAMRLYDRLGFRLLEEKGIYYLMEWTPMMMEVSGHAG